MAKQTFSVKQKVKLFSDEDRHSDQEITIDPTDELEVWCIINHDGSEISLSLENMKKLKELMDDAIKIHDSQE